MSLCSSYAIPVLCTNTRRAITLWGTHIHSTVTIYQSFCPPSFCSRMGNKCFARGLRWMHVAAARMHTYSSTHQVEQHTFYKCSHIMAHTGITHDEGTLELEIANSCVCVCVCVCPWCAGLCMHHYVCAYVPWGHFWQAQRLSSCTGVCVLLIGQASAT